MKRWRWSLLLTTAALLATMAAPVWAAPSVSLTAQPAGEGRVKTSGWTTVLVDLVNQGSEVTGELVVEVATEGGFTPPHPQYVVPVVLAPGAKKRVTVELPFDQMSKHAVRLVSGGRTVAEDSFALTMLPPGSTLVGVLSGDELGMPALARVGGPGGAGATQVIRLDAATFPGRTALLEMYDVIALSRFDTATLSREQFLALETWVGRGGTLVLAGGPEYRRTFAGLPASLVPVNVESAREADLAPLGALVGRDLTGKGPVSAGRAMRGQVLAQTADGTPLAVEDRMGAGKVLYLAADPGLTPLAGWAGQGDLFQRYATPEPIQSAQWGGPSPAQMMMNALQRIPGLGLPSMGLLSVLLLGYLALVGPVNYFVLKRIDKREWAWGTVPLLSVLFVGVVYGTTVGRRTPLVSHLITVTQLSPGTGAATVSSYVGIYAPGTESLKVDLEGARMVRPMERGGGGGEGALTARVVAGEKVRVEFPSLNSYSMKGFSAEQDVALPGGLELTEASYKDGMLTARVANKLGQTVSDVRVGLAGTSAQVGTLKSGETSQPFTLNMGTAVANPKLAMAGFSFLQPQFRPGVDDQGEFQRRAAIWNAMFQFNREGVASGAVMVAGWADQPPVDPGLPELGRMYQGANLVYAAVPIPVDPATGDIPPGLIRGLPVDAKNLGRTPLGWMLPPGSYTFALQIPRFDPRRVAEVRLHLSPFGNGWGAFSVRARDQANDKWVDLAKENNQVLQDWENLLGKDGRLELKLDVNQHTEFAAPTVSVKGVSR